MNSVKKLLPATDTQNRLTALVDQLSSRQLTIPQKAQTDRQTDKHKEIKRNRSRSLLVGGDKGHGDGEWICELTGRHIRPLCSLATRLSCIKHRMLDIAPPPPSDTSSRHRVPDANHPGTVLLLAAWVIWLCQGRASPDLHGRNNAIVRWVFHPLPRPVGFTLDLFYESGSPTPLKGCVVRGAVHPRCSRPSPVRFTAPVRLLAAPPRGAGINGLGLMSGLVPNFP